MIYMGGKIRLKPYIVPIINSIIFTHNIETYIEPFVGGANIIDDVVCKNRLAFDKNTQLIALYKHLQSGGELPDDIDRELFDEVKHNQDKYEDWFIGAIGFLGGYKGRGINNSFGAFGVIKGCHSMNYTYRKNCLLEQMNKMKDVKFYNVDYRKLQPQNSLVYCDPPYKSTQEYNNETFDTDEFWDIIRVWSKDNIVLVSEEQGPSDFDIMFEKRINRSMDRNKKVVTEKLFIHNSFGLYDVKEF